MSHNNPQSEMAKLVHRLKTRLALANFKREHGFENVDLSTLELNLLFDTKQDVPIFNQKTKKRRIQHRFYPTSPPLQNNDTERLLNKNLYRAGLSTPVSEQRSTSPKLRTMATPLLDRNHSSFSSDDEDAAHLLVMMHHSPNLLS